MKQKNTINIKQNNFKENNYKFENYNTFKSQHNEKREENKIQRKSNLLLDIQKRSKIKNESAKIVLDKFNKLTWGINSKITSSSQESIYDSMQGFDEYDEKAQRKISKAKNTEYLRMKLNEKYKYTDENNEEKVNKNKKKNKGYYQKDNQNINEIEDTDILILRHYCPLRNAHKIMNVRHLKINSPENILAQKKKLKNYVSPNLAIQFKDIPQEVLNPKLRSQNKNFKTVQTQTCAVEPSPSIVVNIVTTETQEDMYIRITDKGPEKCKEDKSNELIFRCNNDDNFNLENCIKMFESEYKYTGFISELGIL